MRYSRMLVVLACIVAPLWAQDTANKGPTNEKAQKTYNEGLEYLHNRMTGAALDDFKKADRQDGGHCRACQEMMIEYGIELRDWKAAETASAEIVSQAQGAKDIAIAHYKFGMLLITEGRNKHKDELFARAHEEMTKALSSAPKYPNALLADGQALAQLKQDDEARVRFGEFVKAMPEGDPDRERPSAISVSPNWRGPEWRRRLPSLPWMVRAFRWMDWPGKLFSLTSGRPGVALVSTLFRISKRS